MHKAFAGRCRHYCSWWHGKYEQRAFIPPQHALGNKYGNVNLVDGLAKDGLTDVYFNGAMGNFADATAKECNISREQQDAFAIESSLNAAKLHGMMESLLLKLFL